MQYLPLVVSDLESYALLDSGEARKREDLAGLPVIRPCVQALWRPQQAEGLWQQAESICHRGSDGSGSWEHRHGEPPARLFRWQGPVGPPLLAELRLTSFGHCGVFFEQVSLWQLIQQELARQAPARFLNLFAYTGCASLAAAQAGAQVFHVDSAKGVLAWGKDNQRASGIAAERIRWVHEDARAFAALAGKRGFQYEMVYLDPPAWGRGARKQDKWLFEVDCLPLLHAVWPLLAPGGLLLMSTHTPGVQLSALATLVRQSAGEASVVLQQGGDLGLRHRDDERVLPAGYYIAARRLVTPP